MFDKDKWLSEHNGTCIDDFLEALIADEEKWRSGHSEICIDDHLLSYIPILEDIYLQKYHKPVDYFGLLNGHGLTQEDVYAILLRIIKTGESFYAGYIDYTHIWNMRK